ncbi:MAG: hypothetical protein M3292_00750 [Actinomycetota bacterium]|nr:hypothetical protein [Actinomycetota bacterium]
MALSSTVSSGRVRESERSTGTGSCSATTLTPALEALIRDQIDELFPTYRDGDTLRGNRGGLVWAYASVSRPLSAQERLFEAASATWAVLLRKPR